jgi:hypothetical protein
LLAFTVTRRWPNVLSTELEPGWVPTKMGGRSAPGDITKAHVTRAWLATSDDPVARSAGSYFFHQKLRAANPVARDVKVQEELLAECARISGIRFPE